MKLITYYQTGKIDVFDTATFTATDPFKRDGMNRMIDLFYQSGCKSDLITI